jgi:phosphatidylglycerol:prolipoprotein diacylglycerol transferase
MLTYPHINPIALSLGPVSIHWYGLMYVLAFLAFLFFGRRRASRHEELSISPKDLDELLFYGVLGVVLGGRLGEVLFYAPDYYREHPWEIFAVWKGGMSFHGGFLGVLIAMGWCAYKQKKTFLCLTDFIAPLVPPGLALGRLGNFINGELWGRPASLELYWAMIFPHVDNIPRHPSQLYQAGLEGLLLSIFLAWFCRKPCVSGLPSALFLVGYGWCRFVAELFREPDQGIFGWSYSISMGQWLSLPMVFIGLLWLFWLAWRPMRLNAS